MYLLCSGIQAREPPHSGGTGSKTHQNPIKEPQIFPGTTNSSHTCILQEKAATVGSTKTSIPVDSGRRLYSTDILIGALGEVIVNKRLSLQSHGKMAYCPPTSPVYTPHIAALALTGRVINCTVPDGNCLFRSFSKGLLGTERFHYSIRSVLVSFIIRNALYFDEHTKARNQTSVQAYCQQMGKQGEWGTDIEILAMATILQVLMYAYTLHHQSETFYHWIRYKPFHPAKFDTSALERLMHMTKPPYYHLELLHLNKCHYDLIVSAQGQEPQLGRNSC